MTPKKSEAEREPFTGDAGNIEDTEPSDDPINKLESKCSDPACDRGTIGRYSAPRVCPCLYEARVDLWLYLMQFQRPVDTSPLMEQRSTGRLVIRGSTWATTTRHLSQTLLARGLAAALNSPFVKTHQKIKVVRLTHLVDAVMRSKNKFAPYAGKVLIVRTTAGSPRTKEVNADCLHEFLMFCEDHRACVWLVDEPSERLAEGHRAWSPDVGKTLKEMNFVEVAIEPAPDLDLSLLDRVQHVPPLTPPVPPRPAYVHPDPSVVFIDGNVPTSRTDAAGMLAPRPKGAGSAARLSVIRDAPPTPLVEDSEFGDLVASHVRTFPAEAYDDMDDMSTEDGERDGDDPDQDDDEDEDDLIDLSGV